MSEAGLPNGNLPEREEFVPDTIKAGDQQSSESPSVPEGENAYWRQYCYALSAHLGAFIMACVWSWSSTALPSLRESFTSVGVVTPRDEAWIAAITFLGGVIGSPLMGQFAQKVGLKLQLVVASILLLFFWILIGAAQNVPMIIAGRFFTGVFVSGVGVSTMLVSEYCQKERRGRLNYGFDLMFCAGVLFIYIIGTFFSWRVQAYTSGAVCFVYLVLLIFFIDESPRVLIKKRKENKARTAIAFLQDIEDRDANSIVRWMQKDLSRGPETGTFVKQLKNLMTMDAMKPIIICIALQFFLQSCGVVPIVCYAVDVFKAAGAGQVHENVSTIVLGTINLVATIAAFFLVDKAGRRKLMIFSETCLTVTLGVLGIFLYYKDELKYTALDKFSWFTLACLVVFIATYSFGVGPIPWVIMGEIVSPSAKGISTGIINFAARIFGFFLMFYFKDLNIALGQHGVYWLFSLICFLGLLYSIFFLPETKGLSLEMIQKVIKNKWIFLHQIQTRENHEPVPVL